MNTYTTAADRSPPMCPAYKPVRWVQGCMACLSVLSQDKEHWATMAENDALRVFTDVLGPPPPGLVYWEFNAYKLWEKHDVDTYTCIVESPQDTEADGALLLLPSTMSKNNMQFACDVSSNDPHDSL